MRRILAPLMLVTFIIGLVPAAAQAANATPGCITKTEFRAITKGTTLKRARQIVGATGRTTYSTEFSDGDI